MTTQSQPPSPAELFQRYLQGQADAQATGLGVAEAVGDVVPHDAAPIQPIDPKQAWEDAWAVLAQFSGLPKVEVSVPPDWPALVSSQEPMVALAFCLGNTPQLVRNVQPLLAGDRPAAPRMVPGRAEAIPGLVEWAARAKAAPARLLAGGVLRLARHFAEAKECLQGATGPWQAVAANEAAALEWHQGGVEVAAALWNKQAATTPVLFNRGMAALFLGDLAAACKALTPAVEAIPETSPWHHLGRLYLTLAERE